MVNSLQTPENASVAAFLKYIKYLFFIKTDYSNERSILMV